MKNNNLKDVGSHWISTADMMSGLMLIFMYLFIAFIAAMPKESSASIIDDYQDMKDELYMELYREFRYDLPKWQAEIDKKTLIISFHEPEILFEKGKDVIKPLFSEILDDFFPRYIKILARTQFRPSIHEIRIEGHTSTEWNFNSTDHEAYINNMNLSQKRTSKVLNYLLEMKKIKYYKWMRTNIVAVGYSSSKARVINGYENKWASRRVEFRVITNAEEKLYELIHKSRDGYNVEGNLLTSNELDEIKKLNFRR